MANNTPFSSARKVSRDQKNSDCDGLIETGWLAAAIVVPLVFNQHALIGFGLYKTAILRLLVAIIAAAWTIKACLNNGFTGMNRLPARPVMIALVLLLGTQLLATVFSVNPQASFWGGMETSEGLLTSVAEAVLFLAIAGHLRCFSQIDRLVAALVATSIPVALYAIIQRAGFDPIAFADTEQRGFSTLGHPIYLAAYLTMVMPLTWWNVVREAGLGLPGNAGQRRVSRLLFHAGVALVQIVGFVSAQSRGPLLGLMATAIFFGVGWAVYSRRLQLLLRLSAFVGIVAAFFVFLNLPLPASTRVANALRLERFANTLGLREGPDPYRKAHWSAAVDLMTSPQTITFPNGGSDRWHVLRPWIGYGPETLENVLPQIYIWPGTDAKTENRLHNRVLDLWFSTGIVGVLAFYTFFVLIFQYGLQQIGLGSQRFTFILLPASALIGSVLFWTFSGRGFFGLGFIVGLVAGCGLTILVSSQAPLDQRLGNSRNAEDRGILIIALLAGLVGHLLETGFAFTVPATALLFWLYAAMVIALKSVDDSPSEPVIAPLAAKPGQRRSRAQSSTGGIDWREAFLAALGPALILGTLVFDFVQMYSFDSVNWTSVLGRTLTQIKGDQGASHLVWFLFIPTWLATNFVFAGGNGRKATVRTGISLLISAGIAGAYAIVKAMQIAGIGALPRLGESPTGALAKISGYHSVYFTYIGLVLVLMIVAASIFNSANAKMAKFSFGQAVSSLAAVGLGLGLSWFVVLRSISADITATWGEALHIFDRLEDSTEVLRRSVVEEPDVHAYRVELAGVLIQRADASRNFESFDWLCHEAETILLPAAMEAHGLNTAGGGLARLYLAWAAATPDGDQRLARAHQAAAYFGRAQIFMPGHALSWMDSAVLDHYLHQPQEADRKLERAARLMSGRAAYWANFYREQCAGSTAPELCQAYAAVALSLFEVAIRESKLPDRVADLRFQRANLNLGLGHIEEARQECVEAEPALPLARRWEAEAFLAEIDRQTGNLSGARMHMEIAIHVAPEETKAALIKLKATLQ